jgi:predicted nucleotidyltransferase
MPPLADNVRLALASFRAKLRAELGDRVRRVVLFGSVARGKARWDSDVDVLVLLDRAERADERRIIDMAADELPERGVLLSPTVMSEDAFAALEARERRLARDIADEGIPI